MNLQINTPAEQFGDFLAQLPVTLYLMVCGAGLLLTLAIVYFAYIKPTLARRRAANQNSDSAPPDDLPDLDILLDTSSLSSTLPPPQTTTPETPPPARSKNTYWVRLESGAMVRGEEILAVLRDTRDGQLLIQLDKTGYRTLVDSPEAKQQFLAIMKEVGNLVTRPDDNPPPIEDPAGTPPPPIDTEGHMPGDLPSYKLEESMVPSKRGKYDPVPLPELNIAAAIEAYLQHKLSHSGYYDDRVIHVLPSPDGGVRIQVDNSYYDAVSDVDDEDIRDFLEKTIQEWQERQ